jgi:hypothetical protein
MDNKKTGAALFTVLFVILIVTAVVGVAVSSSINKAFRARKLADRTRAIAIAEAGAEFAYSVLRTNFSARSNPAAFPAADYGGGRYHLAVRPSGSNMARILSTGLCGAADADVVLDIRNYGGGGSSAPANPIDGDAFDYAIVCGGSFRFAGCGSISSTNGRTRIHSNGELTIAGDAQADVDLSSSAKIKVKSPKDIDGSLTAPVLDVHHKANIADGESEEPVAQVEIPEIDLTPWANYAQDNGTYFDQGSWTPPSHPYTPPGGVVYVTGDASITHDFNGTIIANGKVKLSGQADINAEGTFAVVSRDGKVDNTSSGTIKGTIYCMTGDYKQTANGRHEGQLIVAGDISKGGNSDVVVFKQALLTPPGDDDGSDAAGSDVIGISAWQK